MTHCTKNKRETIIVRCDPDMKKGLNKLASDNKRKLSDYLRILIEEAIKNKTKF